MQDIFTAASALGAETWGNVLLDATIKGILLLALAGFVTRMLRRAPAASRHFVWTIAIGAVVALPVASALAPHWNLAILPAAAPAAIATSAPAPVERAASTSVANPSAAAPSNVVSDNAAAPAASTNNSVARDPTSVAAATPAPVASPASTPFTLRAPVTARDWLTAFFLVWFAGAVVLTARLLLGIWGTARLARRAETVEDPEWIALTNRLSRQLGITRPITLLGSALPGIPMTWGIFYPVILLPEDANRWSDERRVLVLLHELAHVRRMDALTQTIAHVAAAAFWVNPLVWVAVNQMRTERERACDDFVLTAGMKPSAYASDLLEIVQTIGEEPGFAYAALAMARRTEFEGRLLAILDPTARRNAVSTFGKLATAMVGLLLVLPLAAMRPAHRQVPALAPGIAGAEGVLGDSVVSERLSPLDTLGPRASDLVALTPLTAGATIRTTIPEVEVPLPEHPAAVVGVTKLPDDKQTLILVVRAAARMTSDYEKAALLTEIIDKFVGDDSLRAAFISTTATITGDYERQRVLTALLSKDTLSDFSRVLFIKAAGGISSSYSKSVVLTSFANKNELTNPAVRQAFFAAANSLSGYEQQQLLVSVLKRLTKLTRDEALSVLVSAKEMSSNSGKAAVLIAVADKIGLEDDTIRKAYLATAATLTSDSDYRKAMAAAVKVPQQQ